MLLFSFPSLLRSEIPAETFLELFLHLVRSLIRRQQEVILPSLHHLLFYPLEATSRALQPVRSGCRGVGVLFFPACPGGAAPPLAPSLPPSTDLEGLRHKSPAREKSER